MVSRDVNHRKLYHLYDIYISRPRDEDEHVAGKSLLHRMSLMTLRGRSGTRGLSDYLWFYLHLHLWITYDYLWLFVVVNEPTS